MSPHEHAQAHEGATSADRGHGRRELARIGARATAAWSAEVLTPRRRLLALVAAVLAGMTSALLLRALFLGMDDGDGDDPGLAVGVALVIAAVVGSIPFAIWLARASRRLGSATGSHPHWRDAALLERSVDARGRVALAPGTAERVAVESRRAIASGAIGVPTALLSVVAALVAAPVLLLAGVAAHQILLVTLYAVTCVGGVVTTCRLAGPMALLRDAADAELALLGSAHPQSPPVDPPHGSRLP
ncbi:hypothetical protein [Clavibacter zhangzhiyongii]|uniref:hypothetical protein n=1 Tax=Clavibacter zhangzhiyongii TaxID=2768071 RepID=UPI0019578916|nr:hypothetical protein [Clavibacter zhangzhiyongii]MBM7026415.1 hypothetical protein [Clavibacter zhangzhiyongii]